MRHCCISLLVGLLVVTWLQSGVTAQHAKAPVECCFQYFKSVIPVNKIDSYLETKGCAREGVIFITKKGIRTCVNPHATWVKIAMQQVDAKQGRKPIDVLLQRATQQTDELLLQRATQQTDELLLQRATQQTDELLLQRQKYSITTIIPTTTTETPCPHQIQQDKILVTSNMPVHTKCKKQDTVTHYAQSIRKISVCV